MLHQGIEPTSTACQYDALPAELHVRIALNVYMSVCGENTKLVTNNSSGINTEIKVNRQKLGTVTIFKYLGSVIIDEGSKLKILSKIAQTTAALTRLKPVWNDRSISFSSKI